MSSRRYRRRGGLRRFLFGLFDAVLLLVVLFAALMILNPFNLRDTVLAALSGQETRTAQEEAGEDGAKQETEETEPEGDTLTAWENSLNSEIQGEKYYYSLLTDEAEQQTYHTIVQGLEAQEEEIELELTDADRVGVLFDMVLRDYPEYFWCDGSGVTTVYTGPRSRTILEPGYTYAMEQRTEMQKEIDAAAEECLSGIAADATDYRKIQHVYNWIVDTVEYDASASDNQNIYSVFAGRRSVCAGYSKATQYLLERMGVFCTYVTGEAGGNARHAWNLVRIGEDYYYVDTTWGDPVFMTEMQGEAQDYVSYDYLCCDDTQLFMTHTPDSDFPLPACTHMEYNYYVINDMYYTSYDPDLWQERMDEKIDAKENPTVFKFASHDLYLEAHDEILGNLLNEGVRSVAERYGQRTVRYQYLDDEELNKITIYWQYD